MKGEKKDEEEGEMALTNVLEDVDNKERRDQVVDALYVAAGWMADGPDKKDPLKNLTKTETRCQNSDFNIKKNYNLQ